MEGTDGGSSGVGFGSITRAEAAITGRGVWEYSKEKRREENRKKRRKENGVRDKKSLS